MVLDGSPGPAIGISGARETDRVRPEYAGVEAGAVPRPVFAVMSGLPQVGRGGHPYIVAEDPIGDEARIRAGRLAPEAVHLAEPVSEG